jgi:hypothetical protein
MKDNYIVCDSCKRGTLVELKKEDFHEVIVNHSMTGGHSILHFCGACFLKILGPYDDLEFVVPPGTGK